MTKIRQDLTWSEVCAALEAAEAERDALRAEVARLQDLLREAADDIASYVRQDYPETDCAKYPDIQRRHQRDMELCRRIGAALAGDK
jgi:hypothetical protein